MARSARSGFALGGLLLFITFMGACFLWGGASRADVPSQMIIRAVAVLVSAVSLFLLNAHDFRHFRAPLIFLGALLLLMIVQLIPLPPALWMNLPGRALLAQAAALAGLEQPWRPISIVPDATVNSLLAMLPAFAALFSFALVRREHYYWMLLGLAGLALLSGVIGLIQISSSNLYFYDITNTGSGVGVFANRNHQAALLAMLLPTLAMLAAYQSKRFSFRVRAMAVGAVALFVLPLIVVTGSRVGLVLMIVGIAGGIALLRSMPVAQEYKARKSEVHSLRRRPEILLASGAAIGVIVLAVVFSRAVAIERLFLKDIEADFRLLLFSPMVDIAKQFFPFGAGFGTFSTVFKIFEPDWFLGPSYFNHAHNDLLEVIIEGGAFSAIIVVAFVGWCLWTSMAIWKRGAVYSRGMLLGRLGSVQALIFLMASLADYPLRTPICSALFVLSVAFMCVGRRAVASGRGDAAE